MNDIVSSSTRCSHIYSFSTSTPTNLLTELNGGGANLIWINPDNSHNMHDNSISSGDTYMSTLIPQILSSTEFTTTKAALLVTFDEGNNSYPSDYVYTILAGPATKPAYKSTALYDHYSFLATLEKNWGLACIASTDCNATPMTEFFGTTTPPPLSTSFTVSPIAPLVNAPVTFTATSSGGVSPYSISWNFGDGASGTGPLIVHTFTSAQTFTVTEKVTDSSSPSQTATSSNTVTVLGTPPPLSTGFTFLPTTPSTNSLVIFTAVTTGGTANGNRNDCKPHLHHGPAVHGNRDSEGFVLTSTNSDELTNRYRGTTSNRELWHLLKPSSGLELWQCYSIS